MSETMKFDAATFEALQRLVYPLVEIVFGIDADGYIADKSTLFIQTGEAISEVAELFLVAGSALEDGVVTEAEVEVIIDQAITVGQAISEIAAKFSGEDVIE